MDWKTIRKIDAHVHLLPPERLAEKREYDPEVWGHAGLEEYAPLMEAYHVEGCVTLPINDQGTFFSRAEDTNRWLAGLMEQYPGKIVAFAEILNQGGYFALDTPPLLRQAHALGLKGVKIHPSNLGIAVDSLDMVPVFRTACDLGMPVMIHSYPYVGQDYELCAPSRIHRMARIFPDAVMIISHMGGARWLDALMGNEYVDISTFLPELVRLYGIDGARRILHEFGAGRLLFGTDYPQVYKVKPADIYETYFSLLDQMAFSEAEMERIAWGNICEILKGSFS